MKTYDNTPITPNTFLRTMSIIHGALLVGQALFAAVTFFLNNGKSYFSETPKPQDSVYYFIVPIMTFGACLLGTFIFKQLVTKISPENPLSSKIRAYQSALIIRYALVEGTTLFAIVVFLITANLLFIAFAVINIAWFIVIRPTAGKVVNDLNLTFEEKSEMGMQ